MLMRPTPGSCHVCFSKNVSIPGQAQSLRLRGQTQAAAQSVAPRESSPLQALLVVARSAVPDNVVAAAVNMNILGIITFSLFFGLCLSQLGEQADGLISLVNVRLANLLFFRKRTFPSRVLSVVAAC